MSKHNKANKNNYVQAGRLTPDEMARERMNQGRMTGRAERNAAEAFRETGRKENVIGQTPHESAPGPSRPRSPREAEE
jgi:hypothetical protein